jgi:hypothetical protein
MKKQTLSWSIPFAIHKQNAIVEIKRAFPAIALVRIAIVFTAIFLPIRFLLPRWLPDLDADWAELYFVPITARNALFFSFVVLISACVGNHQRACESGAFPCSPIFII